ncbi:hypothetical protein GE09DRAFT_1222790 [Coniochaeta sp. 2T2.1]|nr:hypothetical protein GE09DRAFT_1222790 [Coniochaeta sp. 2T2.1]
MTQVRCRMEVEVNVSSSHRPIEGRDCGPRDVGYDDTESDESDYDYGDYEETNYPNDGRLDLDMVVKRHPGNRQLLAEQISIWQSTVHSRASDRRQP